MTPADGPVLVRESGRARAAAERARIDAGYQPDEDGNWPDTRGFVTRGWPDPYGPDPVVFGAVRRVKGWTWDL